MLLLNSLCFSCLEKLITKFRVFPVPWPSWFSLSKNDTTLYTKHSGSPQLFNLHFLKICTQIIQSTTVNWSPSTFKILLQINRGANLRVQFSIRSQCSVSREIVRIKHSAELSECRIKHSQLYLAKETDSHLGLQCLEPDPF